MPLITDHGNGYVERIIAPAVALYWDWRTNGGTASFQLNQLTIFDDIPRTDTVVGRLDHTMDPVNPRIFEVPRVDIEGNPVLDEDEAPIMDTYSTTQIRELMKAVFEHLYEEYEAETAVVIPEPEPE